MNFVGYLQLRRGIMDHLVDGRLSNQEALVLVWLIMLADKSTGRGTINAPTLRTFLPGLSYPAAKRVLLSLEEKQYIFRKITPFSKLVYPYWVNRYHITDGPYKMRQIDLSQVFESGDVADIRYIHVAPEGARDDVPEGALDPALNYNKRETKTEKQKCSSMDTSVSNSVCSSGLDAKPITETARADRTQKQACALPCALPVDDTQRAASTIPDAQPVLSAADPGCHAEANASGVTESAQNLSPVDFGPVQAGFAGLKWDGEKGAFLDLATGLVPNRQEALHRLTSVKNSVRVKLERTAFDRIGTAS